MRRLALVLGVTLGVWLAWPSIAGTTAALGVAPRNQPKRAADRRQPFSFVAQRALRPFSAERLHTWITAVLEHEPGAMEPRTARLSMWTNGQLAGALKDFEEFRSAVVRSLWGSVPTSSVLASTMSFGDWKGKAAEALEMVGLTPEEAAAADPSRIYKRAAILHTDIAVDDMLSLANTDQARASYIGSLHFGVAMALVDALAMQSSRDPFIRQWYTFTAAFLQRRHEIDSAPLFFDRAIRRFPDDARLLLLAGAVDELLASRRIQNGADLERSDAFSRDEHLSRAEKYFTGALTQDAQSAEARLRLGHVLLEERRYREALAGLEPVQGLPDRTLAYFGHMFTGLANEALHDDNAAGAAYRRAEALYPAAQSAQLALSHLARMGDHRAAAFAELQPIMHSDEPAADPWNNYFEAGHGELARDLLADLRAPFRKVGTR